MISPIIPKSRRIEEVFSKNGSAFFVSESGTLRITVLFEDVFRISFSEDGVFDERQGDYLNIPAGKDFTIFDTDEFYEVKTKFNKVTVNKSFGSVAYEKDERLLFSEDPLKQRTLEKFDAYRLKKDGKIVTEDIQTADGIKKHVVNAEREYYKTLCHTKTFFNFDKDERIYGLGQYEEGVWNYRNITRYIHQANKQIGMPVFVSSNCYGVLFTTMSPAIFSDTAYGSYMYTEADYYSDYILIAPDSFEEITKRIRLLTGRASMLPKWAYSYVQSRERYENQQEILDIAAEFKRRNIPLGCIVLDWLSWEDGMWGQKSFDKKRFPNVKTMVKTLNEQGTHFMLSIWPSVDEKCENYAELKKLDLLLPGTNIVDAYSKEGRSAYWEQAKRGLVEEGVEAWWCDSSEPLTPEWEHVVEPVPEEKFRSFVSCCNDSLYIEKGNGYGLFHAKGMYEGSRKDYPERRVVNLTRNGYFGSQQYGAVLWSGDISTSYDTFRKQIVAGLQMAICGNPYWTLDIGAFFVKNGMHWYWSGEYDNTHKDLGFRELYTRWLQYGTFLSMFRSHGTDAEREPWFFGEEGSMFYDAIVASIRLREKLMPYIYSVGADVVFNDGMFVKPAFYFCKNEKLLDECTEFVVGDSLLVCPVTYPMYYDKNSKEINNTKRALNVYLPDGCDWYDYYTGIKYAGGQTVEADAPIDRIPLFVKAGGIVPEVFSEGIKVNIYPGADGEFSLYEDAGDGYGYEKGDYHISKIIWNDASKEATVKEQGNSAYASKLFINVYGD